MIADWQKDIYPIPKDKQPQNSPPSGGYNNNSQTFHSSYTEAYDDQGGPITQQPTPQQPPQPSPYQASGQWNQYPNQPYPYNPAIGTPLQQQKPAPQYTYANQETNYTSNSHMQAKKSKALPVVIVFLTLLLIGGGAAAFFLINSNKEKPTVATQQLDPITNIEALKQVSVAIKTLEEFTAVSNEIGIISKPETYTDNQTKASVLYEEYEEASTKILALSQNPNEAIKKSYSIFAGSDREFKAKAVPILDKNGAIVSAKSICAGANVQAIQNIPIGQIITEYDNRLNPCLDKLKPLQTNKSKGVSAYANEQIAIFTAIRKLLNDTYGNQRRPNDKKLATANADLAELNTRWESNNSNLEQSMKDESNASEVIRTLRDLEEVLKSTVPVNEQPAPETEDISTPESSATDSSQTQ